MAIVDGVSVSVVKRGEDGIDGDAKDGVSEMGTWIELASCTSDVETGDGKVREKFGSIILRRCCRTCSVVKGGELREFSTAELLILVSLALSASSDARRFLSVTQI